MTVNTALPEELRQPTRRGTAEEARTFDQTFLDPDAQVVHRDYVAHALRWGFAWRNFIRHEETNVLDVGCGPDRPLRDILFGGIGGCEGGIAKSYTGVDLNSIKPTRHKRTRLYPNTNFLTEWPRIKAERAPVGFDLITNFEVIEHMPPSEGAHLLGCFRECLAPGGSLLLSTPVFDGARAKNHIHEYTIPELQQAMESAGLKVVERWGTFANHNDIKRAIKAEQAKGGQAQVNANALWYTYERLRGYLGQEVMANFLAPLFPDHARNNIWHCQAP